MVMPKRGDQIVDLRSNVPRNDQSDDQLEDDLAENAQKNHVHGISSSSSSVHGTSRSDVILRTIATSSAVTIDAL